MPGFLRTRKARQDLVDIWLNRAADDPEAADALLDLIEAKCALLAEYPFMGPARDDIRPGLRYSVVLEYLILYRVGEQGVEIVRVVHGRRDLQHL